MTLLTHSTAAAGPSAVRPKTIAKETAKEA
jgi:hypothetical protein